MRTRYRQKNSEQINKNRIVFRSFFPQGRKIIQMLKVTHGGPQVFPLDLATLQDAEMIIILC